MENQAEFRIWGPPGCGKTTTLSAQIRADMEDFGEDGILTCTLTNTAAQELAGRNTTLNPNNTGTLHSICYRLLGCPPVAVDKKMLPQWNARNTFPLSGEGTSDLDDGGDSVKKAETVGDRLYHAYQLHRVQMAPPSSWTPLVREFAKEWEKWKQEEGAIDFIDMISHVLEKGLGPPDGVRAGYLDEAQDFDRLSLTLFRKWGEELDKIVLAGDDDQCLYGFRGSDPAAILEVPIPEDHVYTLSQSYRVPKAVHAIANRWIEQLSYVRQPKIYHPREEAGQCLTSPATYRNPDPLFTTIESYLDQGKTVLILAACAYMLHSTKALLRKNGIPFCNPWRPKRTDWNPLAPSQSGISAKERLLAFLGPDPVLQGEHGRMLWTAEEVRLWADALKVDGVLHRKVKGEIDALAGHQEVTLAQLKSWLLPEAYDAALALDLDWFCSSLLKSKQTTFQYPVTIAERKGPQALLDQPKLMLGTVHSVKGGEADVCFLFPDLPPQAAEHWHAGHRAAIIRQFYVGLTRAKETLVLCTPTTRDCVPCHAYR